MARSLRIEHPGAYYHVMARGNRREVIFHDAEDRRFFLSTLAEACGMTGWKVHAWVLMGNHYHLFIETPEANLVAGMRWLQNTVTRRYNVRHRAWGRLFGDRYKALPVEGCDNYHYRTLVDYIHLNPIRARMIRPDKGESILDYAWSSLAGGWVLPPTKRAKWLSVAEGLTRYDLQDTAAGRRKLVEKLDRKAVEEDYKRCGVPLIPKDVDKRCSHLRRGWYWGTQAFAEHLGKMISKAKGAKKRTSRAYNKTVEVQAHDEAQAKKWLEEGLKFADLKPSELDELKGSDPSKLALAQLIWKRTCVSQEWIARELSMKSAANVSQQLRRLEKNRMHGVPNELQEFINRVESTC
jgi:putative transposase